MSRSQYGLAVWCLFIFFLSGCAISRQATVIEAGGTKMSGSALQQLLASAVIELEEAGMTGRITFKPDGKMTAVNSDGEKETGRWLVDDDDRLCLKFRTWSYGDKRCYTIVVKDDEYQQFNAKGLPVGSFRVISSDYGVYEEKTLSARKGSSISTTDDPVADSGKPLGTIAKKDVGMIMRSMAKNCPSCNLAEAYLAGAMLIEANLEGADLRRADLRNAVLRRANMKNAYLPGARLAGADLAGADLRGADLQGADVTGANFYKARLKGAVLKDVRGADYSGAYR